MNIKKDLCIQTPCVEILVPKSEIYRNSEHFYISYVHMDNQCLSVYIWTHLNLDFESTLTS